MKCANSKTSNKNISSSSNNKSTKQIQSETQTQTQPSQAQALTQTRKRQPKRRPTGGEEAEGGKQRRAAKGEQDERAEVSGNWQNHSKIASYMRVLMSMLHCVGGGCKNYKTKKL